ncbi:uncharacterized protein TM35_000471220 [Trypanosoma theileri]|uniref:Mucin-like glycoprotein n=1 Tax=Trypanosoma theileri TaxID=67003 RepID=A0A1X0NHU2_9TRYP|nr:uncharacterized protein TM35_000471220 [Trypanosoma theileri]ORC84227.1 hypothetical protein TM35_000471220 [Trypanosoma theileri]
MMMIMHRVMCVLAVVLCCACGYTTTAAAAVDNDSPSGRGVSRGAVEVSCGAGGALRVRPAAESEWLTCGAGSRVSACGKYADLCRQRTARAARTTTRTTTNAGQPKAVMAFFGITWNYPRYYNESEEDVKKKKKVMASSNSVGFEDFLVKASHDHYCDKYPYSTIDGVPCWKRKLLETSKVGTKSFQGPAAGDHSSGGSNAISSPQVTQPNDSLQHGDPAAEVETGESVVTSQVGRDSDLQPSGPEGSEAQHQSVKGETATSPSTAESQSQGSTPPTKGDAAPQGDQGTPSNRSDNSTPADSNATQQSSPAAESTAPSDGNPNQPSHATVLDVTAVPDSQENNSTTLLSTENTTTEAPTTTPSPAPVPVTDTQTNTIASTMQKKANADSSINLVWMRTAAPLMIVVVLFSVTVY